MRKIFLAMIATAAIAAIALTGCKKDSKNDPEPDPVSESQIKMQAATDAIGTDGVAFLAKMKEIGFKLEPGSEAMYIKGNEFCYITTRDRIVERVAFYTKVDQANFEVARTYFVEYETACAKVFPQNFAGSYTLNNSSASFKNNEEPQFLSYVKESLKADMFTSNGHECIGESHNNNAERTLTLAKDENEWLCRVYVDIKND